MSIVEWVSGKMFNAVHGSNLVYNLCWEDPRLDRVALELSPADNVLVITSAGCNALDYALCSPNHVYAVDMNPRQNALLDLKMAGIRKLDFEPFFQMFGEGRLRGVRTVYQEKLRPELPDRSRHYWDRWIQVFDNKRRTFFFRGTSGTFARMANIYLGGVLRLRKWMLAMLAAKTLEEQREIYETHVRKRMWSRSFRFAMSRDSTLSLVGVPRAQRRQIDKTYPGGVGKFIQDCVDTVFTKLPLSDNYFWRAYTAGNYTATCCPEYLKPDNFAKLKGGLVDRVSTHTDTIQGFLDGNQVEISRYVLLDHMDWLSEKLYPALEAEWQAIVTRAAEKTRIIWRSGGLNTDFVDQVRVTVHGEPRRVGQLLKYHRELAATLHEKCRVHTYGSFYIADLVL